MSNEMKNAPLPTITEGAAPANASKLAPGVVKRTTAYNIDPKLITTADGWNYRFDMGDIENFAKGIKETLARNPSQPYIDDIKVVRIPASDPRSKDFAFEVVAGHRRLAATQILLKQGVEFPHGVNADILDKSMNDFERMMMLFNENNQKPHLPLEEAAAYKRMRDELKMSASAICRAVGKSMMHVTSTLGLLDADVEVLQAVQEGKVSASIAKDIARTGKGDKDLQKELLADATAAKGSATKADKKAAKAKLQQKLQAKKVAKAAVKGKTLKMRALTDDQLSEIGARMAKHLVALLKDAKMDGDMSQASLQEWVEADDKLAVAYAAGAMDALKVAAGEKINLEV